MKPALRQPMDIRIEQEDGYVVIIQPYPTGGEQERIYLTPGGMVLDLIGRLRAMQFEIDKKNKGPSGPRLVKDEGR